MIRRVAMAGMVALAVSACSVGPNYTRPAPLAAPDATLRERGAIGVTPSPLPDRWWRLFADRDLDRLVEKALAGNTDLRVAAANLQRARAVLSEADAARLPVGDATTSYTKSRNADPLTGGAVTTDYFSIGYDASYEVDLFGGVTRSIQAARADTQAAQAQVDAARVSVAAETARAYVSACSFAAQAAVARETVRLQTNTLDLTQRLFDGGRGTRRDVDRARVLVENANAQLPVLEAERRASLYALAVLTGDPPARVDPAAERCVLVPQVATPIPAGDGQALIARRPDIRSAERILAGDIARVGVATADLYPSIRLLGGVSLGASRLGDIGKPASFGFSLGPLISWNFPFNGAARARLRQSEATATGSLARFDGAVLTALQETEQALARLGGAIQSEQAYGRAAIASEDAARLSRVRFDAGADSFLQLLDAERDRASARAAQAQAQANRADAQVSVFKALGGGWEGAPPVIEKPATTR
ncbi:efflux transporter outer membrane subunit [uncultured Sphingomonas sp.]|uniref:efflux transporter outer membrane subunit n=1 Tax=uncultured Sphingomonas sp. TaxID=158754 RepID=UPI0035CC506B